MNDDEILPKPRNPESERAVEKWKKSDQQILTEMRKKVRLKILVWGPGAHNKDYRAAYDKRKEIRDELAEEHDAVMSEELAPDQPDFAQDLLEQAQASRADFVVILAEGASAWQELIAIIATPEICMKALVHIPQRDRESFGANGPIKDLDAATRGRAVNWYEPDDLTSCLVRTETIVQIEGLRRIHLRKAMNNSRRTMHE
jgi:hypothetical protein